MKQILQSLKTGRTELAEVPVPAAGAGQLLIRTSASLISAGTERSLVGFGRANWIGKARQQPDKVKMVLEKAKTDGLAATLSAVQSKLDQPLALGYCNAGRVVRAGACVDGFSPGDRVISNGKHAEWVAVPKNLCARIPEGVSDEQATFAMVGAIGLQGLRLAVPTLGETIVVTGLGLIGLLTVQLALAHGCRVIGIDFDSGRCALAQAWGVTTVDLSKGTDPVAVAMEATQGRGVDAVLITAATSSNEPVHQAASMCRKRGRIVLVGVAGLSLARSDFYEKELTFQVSCSYGPGRYDSDYEDKGRDYPFGFVRWTLQRNVEAVLELVENRRLQIDPLITHRFPIAEAEQAYEVVAREQSLGIVLHYPGPDPSTAPGMPARTVALDSGAPVVAGEVVVGVLGAGNFSGQVLLPSLARTGARLRTLVSSGGVSGTHWGKKFGFELSSTDPRVPLEDPSINVLIIATRHEHHASLVVQSLSAGKRTYVEKPLCLTGEELADIRKAYTSARNPFLMVGFNRRYAPHIVKIKALLAGRCGPRAFCIMANAGAIPAHHWTQDAAAGGGRILGEAVHYIDLLRSLAGVPIAQASIVFVEGLAPDTRDVATLQFLFEDGSIGTIHYWANGSKSFPKERLEVFCGGGILQLDNFRTLRGFGWPGFRGQRLWSQDKGHQAEMAALVKAVKEGQPSPIPFEELIEVAEVSLALAGGRSYQRDGS